MQCKITFNLDYNNYTYCPGLEIGGVASQNEESLLR